MVQMVRLLRKLSVREALQCVHLREMENKKFERQHAAKKGGEGSSFLLNRRGAKSRRECFNDLFSSPLCASAVKYISQPVS